MYFRPMCAVLAVVLVGGLALAEETPTPPTVINIPAGANPADIPGLAPLLSDNADRLAGPGPWKVPEGDPSQITKADYLELLRKDLEYQERYIGQDPPKANVGAWTALPTYAAFYKATGDRKYLERMVYLLKGFCLYVEEQEMKEAEAEMAKSAQGLPGLSRYWTNIYVYYVLPLQTFEGTPEYQEVTRMMGKVLAARAQAWPLWYQETSSNMAISPSLWYEMAVKWGPPVPRTEEFKTFTDKIWSLFWTYKDVEEDCSGYTSADLAVLDAWAWLRGVKWWEDKEAQTLWLHYARIIGNDGTYPAYGHGGGLGGYFVGLRLAEQAATRCRDGLAKWLAHRCFFNGRDRIDDMCRGIGNGAYLDLALAYLYADDSVKETPPSAGLEIPQRRYHQINDFNNLGKGAYFTLHDRWAPSKLVFRSGPKETDQFMLVQASGSAGHAHPNLGNIIQYSGDYAFYLCLGVTRLDVDMEQHNVFTLRDPVRDKPWEAMYTAEDYAVPVSGQSPEGAYARLHVQEAPQITNVEEAWQKVQAWAEKGPAGAGAAPHLACGYKSWPVRLDRSIAFVNNQFAVVRDVMTPTVTVRAQIGQNWTFGNFGPTVGENWVNVWTPNPLHAFYHTDPPLQPLPTAQRDLLIWFAPRADGLMQIVDGPKKSPYYGNYFINLPRRVWYPRTADWEAGKPVAFTTVLLPHAPVADPSVVADRISLVRDSAGVTAILVKDEAGGSRSIILNSSGRAVTVGTLTTDAEAVLISRPAGQKATLSAWHATAVKYEGKELHKSDQPKDVYRSL